MASEVTKPEQKSKLKEVYDIIYAAAEKLPHEAVDDMSDKFSIVLAFVSSIVLSFLFPESVDFVKRYQIYLGCNEIQGRMRWTYNQSAHKVNYNAINIVSFTAAYFLAWIAYKFLRPVGVLKICLLVCLGLYGSCSLVNSLFFCREIIVAMCVDVEQIEESLKAANITIGQADEHLLNCELSRDARSTTNFNFTAIMCMLYIASIPAAYRIIRMAKAAAFNEELDKKSKKVEVTVDPARSKSSQTLPVQPSPAWGAGPVVREDGEQGAQGVHKIHMDLPHGV